VPTAPTVTAAKALSGFFQPAVQQPVVRVTGATLHGFQNYGYILLQKNRENVAFGVVPSESVIVVGQITAGPAGRPPTKQRKGVATKF
jgi:hypothetical protein